MNPIHTLLPILLLVLAGCAGDADPTAATKPLPLEVGNRTETGLTVNLSVADAQSGAVLWQATKVLGPGDTRAAGTVLLTPGEYVLAAQAGDLSREVAVTLDGSAIYYRFAVHDDVIAFQTA